MEGNVLYVGAKLKVCDTFVLVGLLSNVERQVPTISVSKKKENLSGLTENSICPGPGFVPGQLFPLCPDPGFVPGQFLNYRPGPAKNPWTGRASRPGTALVPSRFPSLSLVS